MHPIKTYLLSASTVMGNAVLAQAYRDVGLSPREVHNGHDVSQPRTPAIVDAVANEHRDREIL